MIYTFIKNNEKIFPIEKMCRVLQVGRRSYYDWKSQRISDRKQRVIAIKEKITSIYFESKQRYGSPRIAAELNYTGTKASRVTVAKYMNQLGLRSRLTKKFKGTTNSKHDYLVVSNVLNREFLVAEPSKVWVSDSTNIHTNEGCLYLTNVTDLSDRKTIEWNLSDGISTEETELAALKMAATNRTPVKGLIFHSDKGFQYASKKFTNVINSYKVIKRNMSRKGSCWDNAVAESFFKTLKIKTK
jgi:transposase InsO family protein